MNNKLLLLLLMALWTVSCTQSSDDNPQPSTDLPEVLTQNGDWKVTYFWDKDKEETNKFSGYTFRFSDNGILTAFRNGASVQTGQWAISDSSRKLVLSMGAAKPLEEMNDDWIILERNDNSIKLRDDNDEHREELYLSRQ